MEYKIGDCVAFATCGAITNYGYIKSIDKNQNMLKVRFDGGPVYWISTYHIKLIEPIGFCDGI